MLASVNLRGGLNTSTKNHQIVTSDCKEKKNPYFEKESRYF